MTRSRSFSLTPEAARGLADAASALEATDRVLITSHLNPDGDAVGSVLALAHGLAALGISSSIALHDRPPEYCHMLPGVRNIQVGSPGERFPLAVVCDSSGIDRTGDVQDAVLRAERVIEIDHHQVARPFGDIRVIDVECAATAQIVHYLLRAMKVPYSPEIATCLMMGVATDTGAFRFTNVDAETFRIAAELTEAGADLTGIMDRVYDQKSVASLKLLERALEHLHVKGGVATATLALEDFQSSGAAQSESDGVVGHLRSLRGVMISALLREAAPGEVRISLRGRPGVNVAELAARFGGGGHAAAAGCTIFGALGDAEHRLRTAALESLNAHHG